MTNEQVIQKFLEGEKKGSTPLRNIYQQITKGRTLQIMECYQYTTLVNYNTPIAFLKQNKNELTINTTKWGATTSKIQTKIKQIAMQKGYTIREVQPAKDLNFTQTLLAIM